jgi:hypothetical protein
MNYVKVQFKHARDNDQAVAPIYASNTTTALRAATMRVAQVGGGATAHGLYVIVYQRTSQGDPWKQKALYAWDVNAQAFVEATP